ncbi:hypothetical protein COCC4DRAFT_123590 [Bipolaris maydis ATCC 48331]|uniref:Intradiol ring-cleavage dioxygenases domain-containing protein n=2 Tax=Cochliobolus heterostrophus TaxID=5016 RepID=M2V6N0_COCH5|nr:uncharacterized protein COCC4DRAFT_123590 [Bipolaris maydis ATCC 48331]EMD95687.1 hypothetical protein COCHEDRAFT_1089396 [Bipolaris maydis C5]KAJ5030421.1 Intradiol ring-cleavage dioxygenase [Bipolaris maydis]ENI10547.1 hypothetical protein COCC4DRAFT_123590 [Bipolaris maydis ATCC 48331]KAJ5065431.1 protocatechuate dioxygenase [Bipolaris maydis]KAJ6200643.1 protocatechuate dioxygenase [Bipolaris maydis]
MVHLISALTAAFLASTAFAHGDIKKDILRRQAHLNHPERRSILDCKRSLVDSGWVREQHQRREDRLHELRVEAGFAQAHELVRRDPVEVELSYGKKAACTLDIEQTDGPFYVSGELIRQNILSGQIGPKAHVDINLIDVRNCMPIEGAYIEVWGTNVTGIYSGVQSTANGDGSADFASNALRGIQPTNHHGTASFITLIPGHYASRTNHLHTIVHHDAKLLPNNTITGGTISHVGQFYFQQDFLDDLESTYPYNLNKQFRLLNDKDPLFVYANTSNDDPFMKVSKIGKTYADGLYATIDVGVNPEAIQNWTSPVGRWTAEGTVPDPDSRYAGWPGPRPNASPSPSPSPSSSA